MKKYVGGKHFAKEPAAGLVSFDLWGANGWCNQEVVGESFQLPNLQRLFDRVTAKHQELETIARLVPEPDNRHDPDAVAVHIDGHSVGYLPREVAVAYRQTLAELTAEGFVAQVACKVWGGLITDFETNRAGRMIEKERFTASVTIALAEPHLCMPNNSRPPVPYLLLPDGGSIQISGEDRCMPAIEPLLRPVGEGFLYATLHELPDPNGRDAKDLVEVRVEGLRVGQLTPKMSGELLPAIRHLAARGYLTASKAKLKGNRLKAEITLHCARAHELPADWPSETVAAPPAAEVPASVVVQEPTVHAQVPPKPQRIRFAGAPGWPAPPEGWEPPPGWQPHPSWGPAPAGWQFWVTD